jgi:PAS domain S-box-containing protein
VKDIIKKLRTSAKNHRAKNLTGSFHVSKELYRLVIDNLEDYAIFTVSEKGMVTSWNKGAQKLLGYRAADILANDINVIFSQKDRDSQSLQKEFKRAHKAGQSMTEGYHCKKDGSTFWASCLIFPLTEGGAIKYLRDTR